MLRVKIAPQARNAQTSFSRLGESLCSCPVLESQVSTSPKRPIFTRVHTSRPGSSAGIRTESFSWVSVFHCKKPCQNQTVSNSILLVSKHEASPLRRRRNSHYRCVFSKCQQQLDSCLARAAVTLS